MKKTKIFVILLLCAYNLKAQINTQLLNNTWIKVKATYNNDKPLLYGNMMKYNYAKYIFKSNGKVGINLNYESNATGNNFMINDSLITIVNAAGFSVNKYKIFKLSADELVLMQENELENESPDKLKIYLVPEKIVQSSHKFKANEWNKTAINDTVYKESLYLYPVFTLYDDFHLIMQQSISVSVSMNQQEGHFIATYIVQKNGVVDSLKIIQGINSDFDKAFIKNFNKYTKNWKPAFVDGKAVNVKNTIKFDYFTSDKMIPGMRASASAKQAFDQSNFEIALHYYNEYLTYFPDDYEIIYKAALCKLALGRGDGVCEQLDKVNQSNTMIVDELIELVCRPKKD